MSRKLASAPISTGARPRLRYFDAHNHLQDEWLEPHLTKALRQLQELPVAGAVVNGTCEEDWDQVAAMAKEHPWIRPSFGLHPWLVGNRSAGWQEKLNALLAKYPKAKVGEIGLDRWITDRARPDDPRLEGLRRAPIEEQRDVFTFQLQLSLDLNRAVTIHCLDAWGALWEFMRRGPPHPRGFLLHAYGGPAEMIPSFAERGGYFSFNGYFLGEGKQRQQEAFRHVPLDRLLVETDAPSMPLPTPWRTHKLPTGPKNTALNHPANIEAVYAGLAALRSLTVQELCAIAEENFHRLFD